jgi:hypothetical protein
MDTGVADEGQSWSDGGAWWTPAFRRHFCHVSINKQRVWAGVRIALGRGDIACPVRATKSSLTQRRSTHYCRSIDLFLDVQLCRLNLRPVVTGEARDVPLVTA